VGRRTSHPSGDERRAWEVAHKPGAGLGDKTWSLDYRVLVGDPSEPQLWQEVDDVLREKIRRVDGRVLPIRAACMVAITACGSTIL